LLLSRSAANRDLLGTEDKFPFRPITQLKLYVFGIRCLLFAAADAATHLRASIFACAKMRERGSKYFLWAKLLLAARRDYLRDAIYLHGLGCLKM
jgi:hypothetical protein